MVQINKNNHVAETYPNISIWTFQTLLVRYSDAITIKYHLADKTSFLHPNTGQVWYLDPHCLKLIWFDSVYLIHSIKKTNPARVYLNINRTFLILFYLVFIFWISVKQIKRFKIESWIKFFADSEKAEAINLK